MSKKRIATSIQLLKPLAFVAERERERDSNFDIRKRIKNELEMLLVCFF